MSSTGYGGNGQREANALDLGSLNDVFGNANPSRNVDQWLESDDEFRRANPDVVAAIHGEPKTGTVNLLRSAGPISDRYMLSTAPMALIIGPGGSGKTTASAKKFAVEAQRIHPGPDGVRRYTLGTWRQKYVNIWKATIPSWWKLWPKDLVGSKWTGASPREAEHIIRFQDKWGDIVAINRFRAFGEAADPDDVLGNEFTDCYLNEWPTLPEDLMIALVDRIGRDPPREITKRVGRMYGDGNAPDVLSYIFRDWYETAKDGYVLYRQPSGLAPDAENIEAVGREYYENSARINAHRPWWINRMIHARPGFTRANMPCWPEWDDDRNMSPATLEVYKDLPVIVGIDGAFTSRAVYMQERGDGQLRILAETSIERAAVEELAVRMLAIEATPRFAGCKFIDSCDPSMDPGEDLEVGSERSRLTKKLGRDVKLAPTQNVGARHDAIRAKLRHTCEGGQPGLIVDPSCKTFRRGANQTYHFRTIAGTDDVGNVAKTLDGHTCEAAEYGALLCGTALARMRVADRERKQREKREASQNAPRYRPHARWKRAR